MICFIVYFTILLDIYEFLFRQFLNIYTHRTYLPNTGLI